MHKCVAHGACLACTLNPCVCARLPPLKLSHRLWVVMHPKEALRTTATGKLLLLAHPDEFLYHDPRKVQSLWLRGSLAVRAFPAPARARAWTPPSCKHLKSIAFPERPNAISARLQEGFGGSTKLAH